MTPPLRIRGAALIAGPAILTLLLGLYLGKQPPPQQPDPVAAQQILVQLRTLYSLPEKPEPTIASITDAEALKKQNPFYNKAKNGDFLIVTEDRAILFDAKANVILDVVPVQLQTEAQSSAQAGVKASASSAHP